MSATDNNPPAHERVLGLDLGDARIGVAICDSGRRLALPLTTVVRVGDQQREHDMIGELLSGNDVGEIVVGLPLSLDGSMSHRAKLARREALRIERRLGVPVHLHDERLSTVEAEQSMIMAGTKGSKKRSVVDQIAATVILQSWLDADHLGSAET